MDSAGFIQKLTDVVGEEFIHTDPVALRTYDCDGLTIYKGIPSAVVLPESTEEVSQIVETCRDYRVPLIARGAGRALWRSTPAGGVLIVYTINRSGTDYVKPPGGVQPGVNSISPARRCRMVFITRPILPARRPAPSAATQRRTPAARIA